MSVPNRQIGWSQESNLLWEITKQMDRLTKVVSASGGGSVPYKVYRATMYQQNDNPPVVTVLENTLGGDIVWTYLTIGVYEGTLLAAFPLDKTHILYNHRVSDDSGASLYDVYMFRTSDDVLQITTWNNGAAQDGLITRGVGQLSVEIKVYP